MRPIRNYLTTVFNSQGLMYANDEPSSWEVVPVAGDPAAGSFADQEQPMHTAETEQPELNPEVAEQLDPGLLMSFLTDFRSAEYEQIRQQREEELAKTRKRVPRRPVLPEPEDELEAGYVEGDYVAAAEQDYESQRPEASVPPEVSEQWAPPSPPPAPDQVSDADFLTAASQPEEPSRRLRLPFGIAGSKNVRQSPATT
ncbi:MAG TPA: hypothetical protein VFV02_07775 [Acidimicrobiales bacterium]|nr:hypothetical protein [Acidimicrobiales bacterium]